MHINSLFYKKMFALPLYYTKELMLEIWILHKNICRDLFRLLSVFAVDNDVNRINTGKIYNTYFQQIRGQDGMCIIDDDHEGIF